MSCKKLRKFQIGAEATAGTIVKASAILRRENVVIENDPTVIFPPEDIGIIGGVDRNYIPAKGAKVSMPEAPATFEQLPYVFNSAIKNVSGVKDGAGSGYIYTWALPTTSTETIKTYTAEGGDDEEVELCPYMFCKSFKLSGVGKEAIKESSEWIGRYGEPNTYTASTISFTAATKTIADSANGLAGFLTGEKIIVSGTTENDGTYTITTGATAGSIIVSESLTDEAAGSDFTIEQTFTSVAIPTVEEILFGKTKLYIDAISGTAGTTQITGTLLGFELDYETGHEAIYTGDGQIYFHHHKYGCDPVKSLRITFEHNSNATDQKALFRTKTARLLYLITEGEALATAGTNYTYKTLIQSYPGKWESFEKIDEQNGNDVVTGVFKIAYDATAATAGSIIVVNELSALP